MKNIAIKLCVAVVFALAAIAAQAQTCTTPDATLISPTSGSVLPSGAVTFSWCNASADYFVIVESIPGAHDIFYAFTGGAGGGAGQTFITLGPACAPSPPIQCIPPNGETIYVTLETVKAKTLLGFHEYTFTAAGGAGGAGAAGFSPTSLSAGSALVGATSGLHKVTLSNLGTGNLTIHGVAASGNFSETDTCTGQTLLPAATCDISVTFTPSVTGIIPGALTISDNTPHSPHIVVLSGVGLGSVSLAPASLSFGAVTVGTHSAPKTITLTNNTSGPLSYTFLASANYAVSGTTCTGSLAGKAKCTINVTFNPTANGAANGSLAVSSASFPMQLAGLSGTGSGGGTSPLTFSPLTQSFASTLIGTASAAKTVTVTNGSVSPVNITNFVASGDFSVVGSGTTPCGGVLGAGASCTVAVAFHPSVPGTIQGSVTLMDNAPVNTQLYNTMGKAVLPVSFSPASLTFTAQTVGTASAQKIVTLTNNQAIALTLTSVVASGQYAAAAGGTKPCGSTVSAHSSCTFAVTFSPKQPGAIPGVVTVTHNASGNPQVVKLTGTGQ